MAVGVHGVAGFGEAGWSLDPASRTPVCTADGALLGHLQEIVGATHDLDGGVIVSWNDWWAATTELTFVTRVAAGGSAGWGNPGLPIQGGDTAVMLQDQQGFLSEPQTYGLGWWPVVDSEGGAWVPAHLWGTRYYFAIRFGPDGSYRSGWFHEPTDQGGAEMRLLPGVEPGGDDWLVVVWIGGLSGLGCDAAARRVLDPEVSWPGEPDTLESPWSATVLGGSPWTAARFDAAADDGSDGIVAVWNLNGALGSVRAQRASAAGTLL